MTDAEIRGRLLEHFYKLRYNNGGWAPISETILAPDPVELRVVGGVCQQLADIGFIHWKPIKGPTGVEDGMAKITGKGVAALEAGGSSEINIRFPPRSSPLGTPPMGNDSPMSGAALTDICQAIGAVKAELPALAVSNSEKADIVADIKQIEAEVERPVPRGRYMKLYLESLRDNLAKAAGAATAGGLVAMVALIGGILAKYFGIF